MTRRRTLLATAGLLVVPGVTLAFFHRPYGPPAGWVVHPAPMYVLPVDPCVCPPALPAPPADCPPATNPPPRPLNPPKVMEKPEAPAPKVVTPSAAVEPMAEKPRVEPPKGELATPSPAVPETPVEKPKPADPKPVLPTVPPFDGTPPRPKKDETIPKIDLPLPKTEPAPVPKLDIPSLNLPPAAEPKKDDTPTIPPLNLPKFSESKYTPAAGPKVRVIAVEGRRSAGNQTVSVYNYTDRPQEMHLDGKATSVPARSLVSLPLPDRFAWKLGDKTDTATIPADAAGLSIVIQ